MPRVIDYSQVAETMRARGFVSLYHNSGAWGFPPDAQVHTLGLITGDDPSIREAARAMTRRVQLSDCVLTVETVADRLASDAWLMPKSHWHYELRDGNPLLLDGMLKTLKIDPAQLRERNDGSAIAFEDGKQLAGVVMELLPSLRGSDFLIAWPDAGTLCTIHHHGQLWWQTTRTDVIERLG